MNKVTHIKRFHAEQVVGRMRVRAADPAEASVEGALRQRQPPPRRGVAGKDDPDRDLQGLAGRVPLRRTNLDGDRQADLRVHGGPDKAVYAYPSEYYELWSRERPELLVRPGAFGENLTTDGLVDDDVSVGDRFRIGTAELVVTQPRALGCA